MSAKETFHLAIELTESLYTAAVIHLVAELRESLWCNLYTSVIYGREIDLLSVPDFAEEALYEQQAVICLRIRLSRRDAEVFLESARNGLASCGSRAITYTTGQEVKGFRPSTTVSYRNEASFWETSFWSRETIGIRKVFRGEILRHSNAWKVAEYLECLAQIRWAPIPLQRYPEKLGDIDELWPSPLTLEVFRANEGSQIKVISSDPALLAREIDITGTLIRGDLIVSALHLQGPGPHAVSVDFSAIDALVSVDGVLMHAQAHGFIGAISGTTTIYSDDSYVVPQDRARPEMRFAMGHAAGSSRTVGDLPGDRTRHDAWMIGRHFRLFRPPADAERAYDPVADQNAVNRAFTDLQQLGRLESNSRILVADPYALEERALHAIAVAAIRGEAVRSILVLTAFDSVTKERSPLAELAFRTRQRLRRKDAENQATRAKVQEDARILAQKIATQLNVTILFYKIERLHDRFLQIGDRLWHVGCSFNMIGREISAIVEMNDERAKSAVFDAFARATSQPPVLEVRP